MTYPDYEYVETSEKTSPPDLEEYGTGWEYWSDRITPDEHVAVWRRIALGKSISYSTNEVRKT